MGMFDTLVIKCPSCNEDVEEQTKSGPCMLYTYEWENCSDNMKYGFTGRHRCYHCKSEFEVKVKTRPTFEVRLLTQDEIDKENYRHE